MNSMPLEEKLFLIQKMKERSNENASSLHSGIHTCTTTSPSGETFEQESLHMMKTGLSFFIIRIFLCVCLTGTFLYFNKTDTKPFGISSAVVLTVLQEDTLPDTVQEPLQAFSTQLLEKIR